MEKSLHEYFASKGKTDETDNIIEHIQKSREIKTIDYLKKSSPPTPGSAGGSAISHTKKTPGSVVTKTT